MFEDFLLDPIRGVTEIATFVAIVAVTILAWKYRRRVLKIVTGDDRIHGTPLDCVWWFFFNCCGLCTGDWTRCISRTCCFPPRTRGQNLITVVGRYFGLTHYTVEIKNIVVGDLPWGGRGDFFLQVVCENNPPMNTSLAQQQAPKSVHFPEVVTLHLRRSQLAQQVEITVRELNLMGSNDVCSCKIRASDAIEWALDQEQEHKMKRIEMTPIEKRGSGLRRLTSFLPGFSIAQPWILLEFDEPSDARELDRFSGSYSTVRTTARTGDHYEDRNVSDFKHSYALLDPNGKAMEEPDETDLEYIARYRWCCHGVSRLCEVVVSVVVIAFLASRSFLFSCSHHYWELTTAVLLNESMPISSFRLKKMLRNCSDQWRGTGVGPGKVPCRPSEEQVLNVCLNDFPEAQPRPTAFADHIERSTGVRVPGLACGEYWCQHMNAASHWDVVCIPACVALVLLAVGVRCCAARSYRRYKHKIMHDRALVLHDHGQESRQRESAQRHV